MTITAPISDEQFETLLSNIAPESAQASLRARDTTQRAALARYETVLDGLPLDAIDGGWTAAGISKRLKATEDALARVEAEAGRLAEAGLAAQVKATTAQAELAEMRRIVAGFLFNYDDGVGKPWERRLLEYARKRVDAKEFNAQAEQQEAKPLEPGVKPTKAQARAALATQPAGGVPLTVWYGSMPESNGKTNWTAILHRKGEGLMDGPHMTIARSEYPDRVRYEADLVRHIIGELAEEPDILAYDADAHSGYKAQPAAAHGDESALPDNLRSHRLAWLNALERLIDLEPGGLDPTAEDLNGYWCHELQAMRDMYADLDRIDAMRSQGAVEVSRG